MARAALLVDGDSQYAMSIVSDFNPNPITPTLERVRERGVRWNEGEWNTDEWAVGNTSKKDWLAVSDIGEYMQLQLDVQAKVNRLEVQHFDVNYERSEGLL